MDTVGNIANTVSNFLPGNAICNLSKGLIGFI